ncbi:MAG: universal stress protein [Rhodospirillaceae bacterium]|nr:MAG: universal stress protein [Rhodospirillaceae bacterium]
MTTAPQALPKEETTRVGREESRVFLLVVDQTEELGAAIRYACNRARRTGGRLALLYAYDLEMDFQHFASVGRLMEREARAEAEAIIKRHALDITRESGRVPEIFVRKGKCRDELFKLVKEHPGISILVLGAAPGAKPGPLVEAVTGKYAGKIGIPVTVVPGDLTPTEIDRLA